MYHYKNCCWVNVFSLLTFFCNYKTLNVSRAINSAKLYSFLLYNFFLLYINFPIAKQKCFYSSTAKIFVEEHLKNSIKILIKAL